ncbi:hypothetical protein ACM66B_005457 [Microbotryomycetes sp. NB124-2]
MISSRTMLNNVQKMTRGGVLFPVPTETLARAGSSGVQTIAGRFESSGPPYSTSNKRMTDPDQRLGMMIAAGGVAALAGAWWYMNRTSSGRREVDLVKEGIKK